MKFMEITGWNHSKQESFPASINLDKVTRMMRGDNEEGRAVIHFVDGAAIVTVDSYEDFTAHLAAVLKV
jgi:hypothetical protein